MGRFKEFIPKSWEIITHFSPSNLKKDLFAGLTVGLLTVPVAMGFAIASGLSPDKGIFTAIIAGFLISLLGGSRVQIGGPTGAFVVVIYGIVKKTGYEGLCASAFIAAILLIIFGLCRFGSLIKYIPHPLVLGFTSALGFLLMFNQIKDVLGLSLSEWPADFVDKSLLYIKNVHSFDPSSVILSIFVLVMVIILRKCFPSYPWGIIAICAGTIFHMLIGSTSPTIFSRFGFLPKALPSFSFPSFRGDFLHLKTIFLNGLSIAFLAAIESLLCAVVADHAIKDKHKPNIELIAQGLANGASVCLGGMPATGAIARTALNIRSGACSPLAGIIHAVVVFLVLYFFSHLISHIPLACLAVILLFVGFSMINCKEVRLLFSYASKEDKTVFFLTFLLTVFIDLNIAICVGVSIASLLTLRSVAREVKVSFEQKENRYRICEWEGPLFFASCDRLLMEHGHDHQFEILILKLDKVDFIDATGQEALKALADQCKRKNQKLYLFDIHRKHAHLWSYWDPYKHVYIGDDLAQLSCYF
ncbi:MAG: SulP family inorganic anion transporter [Rhabdochlamydiaceae bacterium]